MTDYRRTRFACFYTYLAMSSVYSLPPLLFVTFRETFGFSLEQMGLLVSANFITQLTVDALSARYADRIGYRRLIAAGQALIAAGLITLNGKVLSKPSVKVDETDVLTVCGAEHPYVSRGGLKLEKALQSFSIDPTGMVAMDIGASTGGFTDVLLQNGASHVYAIDVGTGQLDPKLLADSLVPYRVTYAKSVYRNTCGKVDVLSVVFIINI